MEEAHSSVVNDRYHDRGNQDDVITLEASNHKVPESIPAGVTVRCILIREQSMVFHGHITQVNNKIQFHLNCSLGHPPDVNL